MTEINPMKPFTKVERIYRQLGELGKTVDDPLSVDELCKTMSSEWAEFLRVRLAAYRADRGRHLRVHGEAAVNALSDFYPRSTGISSLANWAVRACVRVNRGCRRE